MEVSDKVKKIIERDISFRKLTDEEIARVNEQIAAMNKKQEQKAKVASFFRSILFPPLAIAFNVVSVISKMVGIVSAIGIPYGIYCAYKTVVQLTDGVPLQEIAQLKYIFFFIVLPFLSFASHVIFDKLNHYFYVRS